MQSINDMMPKRFQLLLIHTMMMMVEAQFDMFPWVIKKRSPFAHSYDDEVEEISTSLFIFLDSRKQH
jgi:hypothetical protein